MNIPPMFALENPSMKIVVTLKSAPDSTKIQTMARRDAPIPFEVP
jgi:hypothetical protein